MNALRKLYPGDTGHLNIKDMIRNTPMTFNAEYNVRFTDMAIKLLLFQNLYFIPTETYIAGLKYGSVSLDISSKKAFKVREV